MKSRQGGKSSRAAVACIHLFLALMTILSQSFFALVRRHFVSLMLLSVGHNRMDLVNNVVNMSESAQAGKTNKVLL